MKKERMRWIAISVVIFLAIAVIITLQFMPGKSCENRECYDELIASCEKGNYVNEESEASWGYKIRGIGRNGCEIEVTLLQAKEVDLNLRKYEGSSMTCLYPVGEIVLPEKDLSKCSGLLKENLQEVLIENLHSYIIDNLEDIKEGLLSDF